MNLDPNDKSGSSESLRDTTGPLLTNSAEPPQEKESLFPGIYDNTFLSQIRQGYQSRASIAENFTSPVVIALPEVKKITLSSLEEINRQAEIFAQKYDLMSMYNSSKEFHDAINQGLDPQIQEMLKNPGNNLSYADSILGAKTLKEFYGLDLKTPPPSSFTGSILPGLKDLALKLGLRDPLFTREFWEEVNKASNTSGRFNRSFALWLSSKKTPNDTNTTNKNSKDVNNSINLIDELSVSAAGYVLRKGREIAYGLNWSRNRSNYCCLLKVIVGYITKGLTKEENLLGLTPEKRAERLRVLDNKNDLVKRVLKFAKYLEIISKFYSTHLSSTVLSYKTNIGDIFMQIAMPRIKRELKKVSDGFSSSGIIPDDVNFAELKKKIAGERTRLSKIRNMTDEQIQAVIQDADESSVDWEDLLIRCLPALELFDKLIIPAIPDLIGEIEKILYEVFKKYSKSLNISIEGIKISAIEDAILRLTKFNKWLNDNIFNLIQDPILCGGWYPTKKDIATAIESISGGEPTTKAFLETILDPMNSTSRMATLNNKRDSGTLTGDELIEIDILNLSKNILEKNITIDNPGIVTLN